MSDNIMHEALTAVIHGAIRSLYVLKKERRSMMKLLYMHMHIYMCEISILYEYDYMN